MVLLVDEGVWFVDLMCVYCINLGLLVLMVLFIGSFLVYVVLLLVMV